VRYERDYGRVGFARALSSSWSCRPPTFGVAAARYLGVLLGPGHCRDARIRRGDEGDEGEDVLRDRRD
jgi:hypothetical protein